MSHPLGTLNTEAGGQFARATTQSGVIHVAHSAAWVGEPGQVARPRVAREEDDEVVLAPGATRARGAGNRAMPEEPDRLRTCFERDLDRIQHSKAFRRLAGKCQVFIAPDDDHLRTRLTHAIEVAQVAVSIARPAGLNVALTAAAATGHDCGHGPAGHASEEALSPFLDGGYHHAVYGADVVLAPLNLCAETLDAIRNHSWNRPAPATPEGEVVAWADRIAYVCHDFEDAVRRRHRGRRPTCPPRWATSSGRDRRTQLHGFITAMVDTSPTTGRVGLRGAEADALGSLPGLQLRAHLPAARGRRAQADRVIELLRSLTEWFVDHPDETGDGAARARRRPRRSRPPSATSAA